MPKREQIQELLKNEPHDVFLQYALAMAYLSEGKFDEGVQQLRIVVEQHPDYVAAYFQMGQQLAGNQENEPAADIIRRGIEAARRVGDDHAEMEMTGFLETLS